MRPIERGPVPTLPNGQPRTVRDYRDWRLALIDRLGAYCGYCNIFLTSPQVEHVIPQALTVGSQPPLHLAWSNVLLACGVCNRAKWHHPCPPATHYLPDTHNTHLAFTYAVVAHPKLPGRQACRVVVRPGLNAAQQLKANATLGLCKLNQLPTKSVQVWRATDMRWFHRLETWVRASRAHQLWNSLPNGVKPQFLATLTDLALASGFFSVWFDVFHNVPVVKDALIQAFPGTAPFFPAPNFDPVVRIPGDL